MYTLDLNLLLKQLLPPPWRDSWRERLIATLLRPLEATFDAFRCARLEQEAALRNNMQVLALEATLSNIMQGAVRIEHRAGRSFVFFVRLSAPNDSPSEAELQRRKDTISSFLKKHKLAGTSFETEDL